jgi:hypothetical protein
MPAGVVSYTLRPRGPFARLGDQPVGFASLGQLWVDLAVLGRPDVAHRGPEEPGQVVAAHGLASQAGPAVRGAGSWKRFYMSILTCQMSKWY